MNLRVIKHNDLIHKAFNCACQHGWHDVERSNEHWLMMIVTEIAEAIQADRRNLHADIKIYCKDINIALLDRRLSGEAARLYLQDSFDAHLKDTFEDELADIIIRCYDFMGLRKFDLDDFLASHTFFKDIDKDVIDAYLALDVTNFMYMLMRYIVLTEGTSTTSVNHQLALMLWWVYNYADKHDIRLIRFIRHKMMYNENRPFKHERRY